MRVPEMGDIVIYTWEDSEKFIHKSPMIVTSSRNEKGEIAGWMFKSPAVHGVTDGIVGVEYCHHGGLPGEWEWPEGRKE